jgi:hypothetical protein
MKYLLKILILFLLITSCQTKEKQVVVNELLIFGSSGFCMKDSLNNVYPSGAFHYVDNVNLRYDSTRLDIRVYFEFKKDSILKISKRLPSGNAEYFSCTPQDTIGLKELINNSLLNKRFKSEYDFPDSLIIVYDGWHYTLHCKTSDQKEILLSYVPECLPDSLKILHNYVMNLVMKPNLTKANEFKFNPLTTKEAKRLFKKIHPPEIDYKIDKKGIYFPPK